MVEGGGCCPPEGKASQTIQTLQSHLHGLSQAPPGGLDLGQSWMAQQREGLCTRCFILAVPQGEPLATTGEPRVEGSTSLGEG